MKRYRNRPMSLADACIVRLSETQSEVVVFTIDYDFRIYRRHGNKVIAEPVMTSLDVSRHDSMLVSDHGPPVRRREEACGLFCD